MNFTSELSMLEQDFTMAMETIENLETAIGDVELFLNYSATWANSTNPPVANL